MPRPREPETIAGIELIDALGEGARTIVYRARKKDRRLAVKMLRAEEDEAALRDYFHRRSLLFASASHPRLAKVLDVGFTSAKEPFAAFDLIEGTTLASLNRRGPRSESEVIGIARCVTGALMALHCRGLLHGGVRPENVVIGADGEARLVDPDILGAKPDLDPEELGDLMYDPPECLGLDVHPPDPRSDLYCLGAVLFHAATGRAPFRAAHPYELIRQRTSESPPPAREVEPRLSPAFAAILDKLVAGSIDQRYEAAEGLLVDLGDLDSLNVHAIRDEPLRLDSTLAPPTTLEPVPFIDRARQLEEILGSLSLVPGEGAVFVIEGAEGSGKTRLAHEVAKVAARKGLVVLRGACLEHECAPFAELRRALEEWLEAPGRRVSGAGSNPKETLIEAGAGLAPYLSRFWPPLDDMLPEHDEAPMVPESNQIESAAAELLLRIATTAGPVMLVLDDFHWISPSTANAMAAMASRIRDAPLLLLLTGDARAIHFGTGLLLQKRLRPAHPRRLRLEPLAAPSAKAFVQAMLGAPVADESLVDEIVSRRPTTPLEMSETVRALLDAKALHPADGRWRRSEEPPVGTIAARSLDELVLGRMGGLSPLTRRIVMTMAAGDCCDRPEVFAKALEVTTAEMGLALSEAMQAGLLMRRQTFGYGFVHHRVQEALLEAMEDEERRRAHLRVAAALEEAGGRRASACLAAAHYAGAGEDAPPRKLLASSFSAGCAALRARAYEEALPYLETALQASAALETVSRRLRTVLHEALGTACYQTGRLEKARAHFEAVLDGEPTPMQEARSHSRLADIHLLGLRPGRTWSELEASFAALGMRLGDGGFSRPASLIDYASGRIGAAVGATGRRSRALARRDRLLVDLSLQAAQAAYFSLRPDRLARMRLAAMRPAARLGLSVEQTAIMAHQSVLLFSLGKGCTRRRLDRARRMADDLSDPSAIARVEALRARSASQLGETLQAEERARRALEELGPWLDTREYVFTAADLTWNLFLRGRVNEAWHVVKRTFVEASPGLGRPAVLLRALPDIGAVMCLSALGRFRAARFHLEQAESELGPEGEAYWRAIFLGARLLFHREHRDLGRPAEETIEALEGLKLRADRLPLHLRLLLVARAYVRVDQAATAKPEDVTSRRGPLHRAVGELWAAARPPLIRGHALVAKAALFRLRGKAGRADALLKQAEAIGDRHDAPWIIYEATCERARLLGAAGNTPAARRAASSALSLARRNGWKPRARRVSAEFGLLGEMRRRQGVSASSELAEALKMSLWATHSTSPGGQIRVVLDWLMRLFGAERALLLRYDERSRETTLTAGRDLRGNEIQGLDEECRDVCSQVVASGRPMAVQPAYRDTGPDRNGGPRPRGPLRALAAPLLKKRRVAGVLYIDHHIPDLLFSTEDMSLMSAFARHVPLLLDISEEARLEIYERLAANVPGLVFQFVRHPEGRRAYRFVSNNVRRLGLSPEEIRRDPEALLVRIHPEDRPSFERSLEISAERLRPWSWEGRYLLADGTVRWFHGAARTEQQPGGAVLWDGLIMDITRQKVAEAGIRSLNAELEARVATRTEELSLANRELEAFNYSVSHDLRAPLLTIQGFSQEIAEVLPREQTEAREFLGRIQGAAKQMEVLIEAMLSLSRIAHQSLVRTEVDISAMATEIIDNLHRRDPDRKVVARVEPGLKATADEALVRIALENLIENAWKFTRERDVGHIEVLGRTRDGRGYFTVADNGKGFEMKYAHRIFQPFERVDVRRELEGTGVGLATVRRVMQRHGGHVWAESRPGQGARFHFTLEPDQPLAPWYERDLERRLGEARSLAGRDGKRPFPGA